MQSTLRWEQRRGRKPSPSPVTMGRPATTPPSLRQRAGRLRDKEKRMPFYKRNGDELLSAPNFVHGPGFDLDATLHTTYTYPVDGWYWFDTLDAALAGIPRASATITPLQAKLALLNAGLLDQVNTL